MRLDVYLLKNENLTRNKASEVIKEGFVLVNDEVILKPSYIVKETDIVEVTSRPKYVSRAGLKLEDAITSFKIDFKDKTVLDVGSSTGGFTDCSLKHGAKFVYAYDVGTKQMDEVLRNDKRVELHEETNILSVNPKKVDICVIDVSFTSVMPIIKHLKDVSKTFIILFKPQFEVGRENLKKGIVKEEKISLKRLEEVIKELESLNIKIINYKKTIIKGKSGNFEYILMGIGNA